jgi:hypothetical protein
MPKVPPKASGIRKCRRISEFAHVCKISPRRAFPFRRGRNVVDRADPASEKIGRGGRAAILFWPPTMPPTSPVPCRSWTVV